MAVEQATHEERDAAHRRLVDLVLDELKRVVIAINVDKVLGVVPKLVLRLDTYGGPELVIDHDEFAGLAIGKLSDLLGQNLDLELHGGRIVIYCPSWKPDRIPF